MNSKNFFKEKVVLITGASSGIGESAAIKLAQLHAKVVLSSRNYEKLKKLETQIRADGYQALAVKADVARKEDIDALVASAIQNWGKIDVLISNAGQYFRGRVLETDTEIFRESLEVNYFGSLNLIKAALPFMLRQRSGCIVLMNSLDSKKGIVGDGPYVSAKAALDGLGDVLRQELSGTGIQVISVYPGRVNTPMIKSIQVPWISPKISPKAVVRRMIGAMINDRAITVVPQAYYFLAALNSISPRIMDRVYRIFRLQGYE